MSFTPTMIENMYKREKEQEKAKRAKKRQRKKPQALTKLVAEKKAVPINELHKLTDDPNPPFELACNGDRGRLIQLTMCGAVVDIYSTRRRKKDDELYTELERVDISLNSQVRLLRPKKKPGRKKRKK